MLVLTRRVNEDIIVDSVSGVPVLIRILEIQGGKVRVGIEADQSTAIHRREIDHKINGPRTWKCDNRS